MKILLNIFILLIVVLAGCQRNYGDPRKPPLPEEAEELVTTFKIILTDSVSGAVKSYFLRDDDGELNNGGAYYGPDAATQSDSVIMLSPNSVYYCEIILLNETVIPADTVSHEIKEHADEHMIFYAHSNNTILKPDPYTVQIGDSVLVIEYLDKDDNNLPLGLTTRWVTSASGTVRPLQIILKHQEENKDGTFENGETDVEVRFTCRVD
jgi:Tfp pilus assembly protein PilZ